MDNNQRPAFKPKSDALFLSAFAGLGAAYILLILALLFADASFISPGELLKLLEKKEIQFSIKLSLVSSTLTTLFSLWVAVPLGYLLSRFEFRGKRLVDAVLDIPIVLPPIVVGLSLLILFKTPLFVKLSLDDQFIFTQKGVILAQFMVACAFAVRFLRTAFDDIPGRMEAIAYTLGCSRGQAFWRVVFPEARNGLISAATVTWARALGEFGPILIFAGTTRFKTEVLPSTVFLELSIGNLESAVAVSMLMILVSVALLMVVRHFGRPRGPQRQRGGAA